jgi:hypothetical protein
VRLVHRSGGLDRATFERARTHLMARDQDADENPGGSADSADRQIYLDDLALAYLQDAGVLEDVAASGLTLEVHRSTRAHQEALIEANRHGDVLVRSLNAIRQTIREALTAGKAVFLPHSSPGHTAELFEQAPILAAFLESTGSCDAVCIDDRSLNRNAILTDRAGRSVPVLCVLDVLRYLEERSAITSQQRREQLHRLRQASFGVVPIEMEEIEESLRAAALDSDGGIIEGPELRAIRHNLMRLRSLDMLQQPAETAFLDRLRLTCVVAARRLWHDETLPVERASALSEWIWRFVAPSPVDWLRTSRGAPGVLALDRAVGLHIGLLLQVGVGLKRERQEAFREWVDTSVLTPLGIGSPELLNGTVAMLKTQIEKWVDDFLSRH